MDGMTDVRDMDAGHESRLPRNVEAERGLLGALFIDNGVFTDVEATGIVPEMFAMTAHARIFEAIGKLIRKDRPADPTTLRPYFEADESLEGIGGAKYLAHLAASAISVVNARTYAEIIVDCHRKRELWALCTTTLQRLGENDIDDGADGIGSDLEGAAAAVLNNMPSSDDAVPLIKSVGATIDEIEERRKNGDPAGVPTGFYDVDRILGALVKGDYYLLAGRPSMGKTGLALCIARNAAIAGYNVLFVSQEMTQSQLNQRLIAIEAKVAVDKMRKVGELYDSDMERIRESRSAIEKLPIFVTDASHQTVAQVRGRARRMKRKHGLDLIVVDYLGLMSMGERYRGQRTNEVGEISAMMKGLAKDLDVPVLALSQLSRGVEAREDKRPLLSDLRDSGNLEQDADVVMFVYREEYYLEKSEPVQRDGESQDKFQDRLANYQQRLARAKGAAEVIVAKQRQGSTGTAHLGFAGWLTEFQNKARDIQGDMP